MKLNVVIIEDSTIQLMLATKLIQMNKNLNLVGAYTEPFLGLNAVNTQAVDLVFLDVEMPEIDGLSLQKLFNDSVEVIVNSTRPFFADQALANGAFEFIKKPLKKSKIDLVIERLMKNKDGLNNSESFYSNTIAS